MFTAIVAAWTSAMVSHQKLSPLRAQRDALARLTTRLEISDSTSTVVKPLPKVAGDFKSYNVFIPEGKPRELRFFFGEVSQAGFPPEFESAPLSAGQHQIVFQDQDWPDEGYRFRLYIDAQLVIDKSKGKEWMPLGWSSLTMRSKSPSCSPLTAIQYRPRVDYGKHNYFNGSADQWATGLGYQLWIDDVGRTPQPINDFVGLFEHSYERSIGLRDGPRISNPTWTPSVGLEFNHPATRCYASLLTVVPEFIVDGKVVTSATANGSSVWKLSRSADKIEELKWDESSTAKSRSIFLHATALSGGKITPVIELHWTKDRPNDVGLRLPAVDANASIKRWRLRSIEGVRHLWRTIEHGDQSIDILKFNGPADPNPATTNAATSQLAIPLNSPDQGTHSLKWRTNITLPLQIFQRTSSDSQALQDLDLYKGLPFQFGYEIPTSAAAKAWAIYQDNDPTFKAPIPGGRVIDEVVIELDATDPSWTWLRLEPLEKKQ